MILEDRFDLEDRVGGGSSTNVFRARDRRTGEAVAVKIAGAALDEESSRRFEREAAVLSALDHPHIVRYAVHGRTRAGEPFLAMEWLDGEDLAGRLARRPLAIDEVVDLAERVCDALAAAHACGIVHRDVKPSNLFLADRSISKVKLLDFGVARLTVPPGMELTRTGTPVGSPAYMAPEQVRGSRRIDARADLFSLGCVLHECLTGAPIFVGTAYLSALAKVLVEEPPPLRSTRPDVPARLDATIRRLLCKDPSGRPQSAVDVAGELRSGLDPAEVPAPRHGRRSRAVLVGDGPPPDDEVGVRVEPLAGLGWLAWLDADSAVESLAQVAQKLTVSGRGSVMALAAGADAHVLDRAVAALSFGGPGIVRLDDTASMAMAEQAVRDAHGAYLPMPSAVAPSLIRAAIEAAWAEGDADAVLGWIARIRELPDAEQSEHLARGALALLDLGELEHARTLADRVRRLSAGGARAIELRLALDRRSGLLLGEELSDVKAEDSGARAELAGALVDLGELDRASAEARAALAAAMTPAEAARARLALARCDIARGDSSAAARILDEVEMTNVRRVDGSATVLRARVALADGRAAEAESLARSAERSLVGFPGPRADALALVAEALLRQGKAGDALVPSTEATRLLAICGEEGVHGREVRRVLELVLEAARGRA